MGRLQPPARAPTTRNGSTPSAMTRIIGESELPPRAPLAGRGRSAPSGRRNRPRRRLVHPWRRSRYRTNRGYPPPGRCARRWRSNCSAAGRRSALPMGCRRCGCGIRAFAMASGLSGRLRVAAPGWHVGLEGGDNLLQADGLAEVGGNTGRQTALAVTRHRQGRYGHNGHIG
jgi:hypothetical protein